MAMEHTHFLIGNASSKGPFSIAMLDYQSILLFQQRSMIPCMQSSIFNLTVDPCGNLEKQPVKTIFRKDVLEAQRKKGMTSKP